jgi:beta-mannanase
MFPFLFIFPSFFHRSSSSAGCLVNMRKKKSLYHRVKGDISSYINPSVNSSNASGQARKVRVGPRSSGSKDQADERSSTSNATTSGNVNGVTREIFTSADYEIAEEGDNEVEEFNNDNIVEEEEEEVNGGDDHSMQEVKRVKSLPSTNISLPVGDYEPSRHTVRTIAL